MSWILNLKLDNKRFKKEEFNFKIKRKSMLNKWKLNHKCIIKKWNKFSSLIIVFNNVESNNII
jgi:hypothetical protein